MGTTTFVLDAEEAKAVQGVLRVVDAQRKAERAQSDVNREGRKHGRILDDSVRSVALWAAGFLSVGAAVNTVTRALQEMDRVRASSSERFRQHIGGVRSLAQIAETPEDLQRLRGFSEQLRRGGFGAEAAQGVTFQAASAGKQFVDPEDISTYIALREIGFDPAAAIEGTQKAQAAFGGEGVGDTGGGSLQQYINKAIAAAGPSPVQAGEIGRASGISAASFAAIGGQDEANLAIGAVLAETFKSSQTAFERTKTLADALARNRDKLGPGAAGLRGIDLIDEVARQVDEGADAFSLLGSAEAVQALNVFRERREDIMKRREAIIAAEADTGTGRDILSRRVGLVRGEGDVAAATLAERSGQRRMLTEEERFQQTRDLSDAVIDQIISARTEAGASQAEALALEKALKTKRLIFGDASIALPALKNTAVDAETKEAIRQGLVRNQLDLSNPFKETIEFVQDARSGRLGFSQMDRSAENLRQATSEMKEGIKKANRQVREPNALVE